MLRLPYRFQPTVVGLDVSVNGRRRPGEFCQALFLLLFPFTLVSLISQRTARIIIERAPVRMELARHLRRQRLITQIIGMISIFITAFWGVFKAMETGVL